MRAGRVKNTDASFSRSEEEYGVNPFGVIGKALREFWDEMFNLMLCNLLWTAAQLLIVTGPPATAAMFYVGNRVAHGHFARVADFLEGFRRFFWISWKWGALNYLVILVVGYAAVFYGFGEVAQPTGFALMWINLLLLAWWLFNQLFAFPFWLEQEDQRLLVAYRNGLVTQAKNVRLTLMAAALCVIAVSLAVLLQVLIALVTVGFLVVLGNTIVVAQLEMLQKETG